MLNCYAYKKNSGYRLFVFKANEELVEEIMLAAMEVIDSPQASKERIETAVRKILPDAHIEATLNMYGITWQVKVT